jgi:hypothetical protein
MFVALLTLLSGCTYASHSTKVLLDEGYTDIHITGWRPFSCGEGDFYMTGFSAKGPSGRPVTGVVCEGLFKSATVRLD